MSLSPPAGASTCIDPTDPRPRHGRDPQHAAQPARGTLPSTLTGWEPGTAPGLLKTGTRRSANRWRTSPGGYPGYVATSKTRIVSPSPSISAASAPKRPLLSRVARAHRLEVVRQAGKFVGRELQDPNDHADSRSARSDDSQFPSWLRGGRCRLPLTRLLRSACAGPQRLLARNRRRAATRNLLAGRRLLRR